MANSGRIATSKNTSAGTGYPSYVYVDWSASQDAVLNRSTLTWTAKVGSDYDNDLWVAVGPTTVSFNGVSTTIERKQGYKVTTKDCVLGTGTVTIDHDASGAKTVAVSVSSAMYSSSQNVSYSGNITLNPIDRTPPVVTFGTSGVNVNGFTVSAAATSVCDVWEYTVNGGTSWTQFSTTAGTTASVSLSTLSPATAYNVAVRARKKSNQVKGTSAAKTVQTLGGADITGAETFRVYAYDSTLTVTLNVYQRLPMTLALKRGTTTLFTLNLGTPASTGEQTVSRTISASQNDAVLQACPNEPSFTGTLELVTTDGGDVVQTSTYSVDVRLDADDLLPASPNWTYADTNATAVAVTGNNQYLIQGISELTVTPSTATAYGYASIASYAFQIGTKQASAATVTPSPSTIAIGVLDMDSTASGVLTVTDTRGFPNTRSKNVNILPYAAPRVDVTKLRRANGAGADIELAFTGTLSTLTISNVQKNSITSAQYRVKSTASGESWSAWTNIAVTQSGGTFSFENLQLTQLDPMKSYAFELKVQDALGATTEYDEVFVIPQGMSIMEVVQGGIVINGNLTVNGNLVVNGDTDQNYLGILSGEGDATNCYVYDGSIGTSSKQWRWGTITMPGGQGLTCHVSGRATCEVLFNGVSQTLTSGEATVIPLSNYTVAFEYTSSVSRITIVTQHT